MYHFWEMLHTAVMCSNSNECQKITASFAFNFFPFFLLFFFPFLFLVHNELKYSKARANLLSTEY